MSLTEISQVTGIVSMVLTIVTILGKIFIVTPLKNFIEEQTHSIQPHANGGKSLPDVAKNVIEIKSTLESLSHQVDRVENRLDTHIEQHIKGDA